MRRVKMTNMKKLIALLSLALFIFSAESSQARPPEEAEFKAAAILGDEIAEWYSRIEPRPASVAIFSVHSNMPLEQDYSDVLETEILKGMSSRGIPHVSSCSECRSPRITVEDQRVVITKGAPDQETLKKIGRKYPVEAFITVDVYRTKLNVLAQAVIYSNPTGQVINANHFTIPALNFSDNSVQFLGLFGLGMDLSKSSDGSTAAVLTAVNLLLLEDVGFGKGGLDIGMVMGGPSTLIYIDPTLAFYGRFGLSGVTYSFDLGAGYGFSGSAKGIVGRVGYDLFLGSSAVIGVEAAYLLPMGTAPTDAMKGYAGFHVGFSLGR